MTTKPKMLEEPVDFSLVLGGPLYQLFRKAHLEGDHVELLYRRMFVIALLAWLPLLLLALFGSLGESSTRVSFFRDVEVHVRKGGVLYTGAKNQQMLTGYRQAHPELLLSTAVNCLRDN